MNKELEEAIKRLKILECDCIYFENNKCTYNKNKCQREQDIETVLNYIENSIPKQKVEEKIEKLKRYKDNLVNETYFRLKDFFEDIEKAENQIQILQEILEEK